ncbi:hypothetical protein ACO22_04969 [Paracoccidioides brasiliensis]|uniref:Uncharacterized protein n=1 Tax=Paracoccidioides brasiliensis TaxID=121759 RepID=A0A1D2JBN9_PARBR|nr:hypothetical protein ACO22_04969 [Paracoccidioides brasiliensis]ODH48931.1 hypothetical protein GX48_04980 [Paracoccidioides brasiliensis]
MPWVISSLHVSIGLLPPSQPWESGKSSPRSSSSIPITRALSVPRDMELHATLEASWESHNRRCSHSGLRTCSLYGTLPLLPVMVMSVPAAYSRPVRLRSQKEVGIGNMSQNASKSCSRMVFWGRGQQGIAAHDRMLYQSLAE